MIDCFLDIFEKCEISNQPIGLLRNKYTLDEINELNQIITKSNDKYEFYIYCHKQNNIQLFYDNYDLLLKKYKLYYYDFTVIYNCNNKQYKSFLCCIIPYLKQINTVYYMPILDISKLNSFIKYIIPKNKNNNFKKNKITYERNKIFYDFIIALYTFILNHNKIKEYKLIDKNKHISHKMYIKKYKNLIDEELLMYSCCNINNNIRYNHTDSYINILCKIPESKYYNFIINNKLLYTKLFIYLCKNPSNEVINFLIQIDLIQLIKFQRDVYNMNYNEMCFHCIHLLNKNSNPLSKSIMFLIFNKHIIHKYIIKFKYNYDKLKMCKNDLHTELKQHMIFNINIY